MTITNKKEKKKEIRSGLKPIHLGQTKQVSTNSRRTPEPRPHPNHLELDPPVQIFRISSC
jgi:hypothetical protein